MEMVVKHKVPIIITSLGARTDVNDAIHSYGGVVLHDIINNTFAQQGHREGRRRPDRGGGRRRRPCGREEPVRAGPGDPPVVRRPAGAVRRHRHRRRRAGRAGHGRGLRLHRLGLHRHPRGARFGRATSRPSSKAAATTSSTRSLFTGVHGNYLKRSHPRRRPGPGQPARERPEQDELRRRRGHQAKAWKDIWGCGQGIGAVTEVTSTAALVARLKREYRDAQQRLLPQREALAA